MVAGIVIVNEKKLKRMCVCGAKCVCIGEDPVWNGHNVSPH